ncbi:hypothetical protein ACQKGD_22945 [Peribacillus frigoritolerans]|uniref:hypothetical protein n=1 Tax=Peribacillus frigoritolerans TaxID=450367 RepID=UPI0007BF9BE1
MFRKQKIETIDFKTFLAGKRVKQSKSLINNSIYSFFPSITMSGFFTPDIAGLYAVVLGVGAIAFLSHCLEITAANHGHENLAATIETVTRLAFPIGGFSFILWFLFSL